MTEKRAREKGFSSTGHYERFKEDLNEQVMKFKKAGYKCAIVTEPDSKLSRGPISCGYSIYVEERYHRDERPLILQNRLALIEGRKAYALEKYNKALQEIENDRLRLEEQLEECVKQN